VAVIGLAGWDAPARAGATSGFHFRTERFETYEASGYAVVTVVRSSFDAAQATIDFTTTDGTAVAGADYVPTTGTLTFAVGETSQTFTIPILDDNRHEPVKEVGLALHNAHGSVGDTGGPAVLLISDDDLADPGDARPSGVAPAAGPDGVGTAGRGPDGIAAGASGRPVARSLRAASRRRSRPVVRTFQLDTPVALPEATETPPLNVASVVLAALLLGNVAARLWFLRNRLYARP
jgi:hypothetical protein